MAELFNVIFRGDIAPGSTLVEVRRRLRDHFQLDDVRVDQLFSGRPVVVRKHLDRARADRFRDLLAEMGALVQVRAVDTAVAAPQAPRGEVSQGGEPTAAPRPAVQAAVADRAPPAAAAAGPLAGVTVEPPGADVLTPQERRAPVRRDIAVEHLSVDSAGADMLRPHERKKVVELDLDLSHLAVEPAGNP